MIGRNRIMIYGAKEDGSYVSRPVLNETANVNEADRKGVSASYSLSPCSSGSRGRSLGLRMLRGRWKALLTAQAAPVTSTDPHPRKSF